MPLIQKTVYFREEDIKAWESIPNKAEFLHKALHNLLKNRSLDIINDAKKKLQEYPPDMLFNGSFKTCKHGSDPKFCKFSKPGKPCK